MNFFMNRLPQGFVCLEYGVTFTVIGLCKDEHLEGRREILTDGWIHNSHGVWIRIAALQKYILAEVSIIPRRREGGSSS